MNGELIIFVVAAAVSVIVCVKFRYDHTFFSPSSSKCDERRKKYDSSFFGWEENGIKLEWYAYSQ